MAGCTYNMLLVHTKTVFIILQQQKSTTHMKCLGTRSDIGLENEITELHLNCPQQTYI